MPSGYDKGGNRTSEQTDLGVSTATHNDVNQLTAVSASAGPVKFAGRLSETGIVYVANSLATMGIQNTSFVAYASLATGTREVEVRATDYSNQGATNRYQVVITNNGVAKTLSHDINGNLTNVTTATYTNKYEWDGADRLTRISWRQAGGGWHFTDFTYDGLGRRVKITETTNNVATTNTFVWCGTELCEERNLTGATVNKRFFGQGEQISGTAYFFTRDHLGSVREMSSSGGTMQARYEYDPYGRRTKVSGSSEADFAYTGHYYHQKNGLHLALFRAYDSDTGRWMSRDPIEEDGGVLKRPTELPKDVRRAIKAEVVRRGKLTRSLIRSGVIVGLLLFELNAEASANEMVVTLKTVAEDCRAGNDDWAYVGLLTLRHQSNQQAAFSGDVAMRGLIGELGY